MELKLLIFTRIINWAAHLSVPRYEVGHTSRRRGRGTDLRKERKLRVEWEKESGRVGEIRAAVLRDDRVGHECSRSGLDG